MYASDKKGQFDAKILKLYVMEKSSKNKGNGGQGKDERLIGHAEINLSDYSDMRNEPEPVTVLLVNVDKKCGNLVLQVECAGEAATNRRQALRHHRCSFGNQFVAVLSFCSRRWCPWPAATLLTRLSLGLGFRMRITRAKGRGIWIPLQRHWRWGFGAE